MNKRYLIVIALLLIVITACSRSSHIIKNGSIEKTKNEIKGSYDYFNGYKEYDINLENGKYEINITANSDEGELTILINNEEIFNSSETDEKLEKIDIKEKKNKIRIEGDNHKGDFIISWEKSE